MKRTEKLPLTILLALLVGLALCILAGCPATEAAGVRRMAEARLASCRRGFVTGAQAAHCYAATHAFCLSKGLEKTCGEGFQGAVGIPTR